MSRLKRRLLVPAGVAALLIAGAVAAWHFRAESHRRAARSRLARRDFPAALDSLRRYLAWKPRDADARLLAAQTARRAGLIDEALGLYDDYARRHGDTDALLLERTLLTVQRGGLTTDVEFALLDKVQAGHPESPVILEALVHAYMAAYHLPRAVMCLDRWLVTDPDSAAALFLRGSVNEGLRRHEEAVEDYRRLLGLDPEYDEARLRLAQIFVYLRRFPEAAEHLEFLESRRPDDPKVLLALATARRETGRPDDALGLLERLLQQSPKDADALRERARLAEARGNDEEAGRYLRASEDADAYDQETLYLLSQWLTRHGRRQEAQEYLTRMGRVERDLARLGELNTAVAKSPDDPRPRYEAGEICLRNGQPGEAARWFGGALQVAPWHEPSRRALAELKGKAPRTGP